MPHSTPGCAIVAESVILDPVLAVRDLTVAFPSDRGLLTILDRVSFTIGPREIVGIVGESGSGKSMTSLAVMGLIDAPGRGDHRLDPLSRARAARPARTRDAAPAWPRDRDDLPGPDDGADPGLHDRPADRRSDPRARAAVAAGRQDAHARTCWRPWASPTRRGRPRATRTSSLGRAAPARRDRDGRWPATRPCSSPTSPPPRSTSRCRRRSSS